MAVKVFREKFRKFHILFVVAVLLSVILSRGMARADELEDIEKQIADLKHQMEQSVNATIPLEEEVDKLSTQINSIQAQIAAGGVRIQELEQNIEVREKQVENQYLLLASRVRDYYKKSRFYSPFLVFISSQSAHDLTRGLAYKEATADEDKNYIVALTKDLVTLESDKKQVEEDRARLAYLQGQLDEQKDFFEGEIAGAKAYQSDLQGQIAELTAKQQAILSARSGSFITSVGSVPIGSDYNASIAGFESNAPGGFFGVFSFGAYTHRKGMSQYGARARAESGQNYRQILSAYYGKEPTGKDTSGTISVSGYGNLDFEGYYLYGIAEMPSDWNMEALKAQAVAARTYAYRYKIDGTTICTDEGCQVFNNGKAASPPDAWRQAVDQTKGEVLEDVVTFYSSTAGGYLTTSGWDTTDGSGDGDWTSRAWESIAGSPWFYKAWYRQGYSNSSNDCGRFPWMSEEEMADIINAWLVLKQGEGSADSGRIVPVTINSCPIGGQSGDPYSMADLRGTLPNPVTSISGEASVSHSGSGSTTNVTFQTNRGSLSIPGSEFKEVFNTRAPGYISIPQSGFAFFNIERK